MKRVRLHTIEEYRAAAVALAQFAVTPPHGTGGNPVHEWVTEGRRTQYERAYAAGASWALKMPAGYSSCGDLAHWLLMCLGVRDERLVNRSDDGGDLAWRVSVNLSRLIRSRAYVSFAELALPERGDIVHVASPDHVAVLLDASNADQWITADYGQPHGERHVAQLRDTRSGLIVRGRLLQGFVSLERVRALGLFVETAIVPNDFAGDVDDNPYPEAIEIPADVP